MDTNTTIRLGKAKGLNAVGVSNYSTPAVKTQLNFTFLSRCFNFFKTASFLSLCIIGMILFTLFDMYGVSYVWKSTSFLRSSNSPANLDVSAVSIATGGYTADEFVENMSSKGKWPKEKIVLLVDDCRPINYPEKATTSRVRRTNNAMQAKYLKTKVFDHVSTQRVLLLDSAVKTTEPLSDFLREIRNWDKSCDAYMQVYPLLPFVSFNSLPERLTRWLVMTIDSGFDYWNSGLMYLDRISSAEFLEEWGKLIISGDYKKDQWALRDLLKNSNFKLCPLPEKMNFSAAFASKINKRFFSYSFTLATSSASDQYKVSCEPDDNHIE